MERFNLKESHFNLPREELKAKIRINIERERLIEELSNEIYSEIGEVKQSEVNGLDYNEIKRWMKEDIIRNEMQERAKVEVEAELAQEKQDELGPTGNDGPGGDDPGTNESDEEQEF